MDEPPAPERPGRRRRRRESLRRLLTAALGCVLSAEALERAIIERGLLHVR